MITIQHKCQIKDTKIIPDDLNRLKQDLAQYEGKEVEITIRKWTKRRTSAQNNSIHLYCQLLAEALNGAGQDIRKVIRQEVDISWTPYSVKEYLWRPIQKELYGKKSTAQLNTDEVSVVYDNLNRIIAERTGVSIEFPSLEAMFQDY